MLLFIRISYENQIIIMFIFLQILKNPEDLLLKS